MVYNLLLFAIPEDARKSEPINQETKLKTLLSHEFYTRFRPQLLGYFPSNLPHFQGLDQAFKKGSL